MNEKKTSGLFLINGLFIQFYRDTLCHEVRIQHEKSGIYI